MRSWVGSHAMSRRQHVTTLPHFLPLSFCPAYMTVPEPWVGLYGCPIWGWVHIYPYFQHFDQLSISAIIIAYCKRKLLWSMVIGTNIYKQIDSRITFQRNNSRRPCPLHMYSKLNTWRRIFKTQNPIWNRTFYPVSFWTLFEHIIFFVWCTY